MARFERIEKDWIEFSYVVGFSITEIARVLERSRYGVWKYLINVNIPRRSKSIGWRNLEQSHGLEKKSKRWKGGLIKTDEGYIKRKAYNHPYADNRGYVCEHRLIMEKYLGRYLRSDEEIHHLNGIKTDNRMSNLEIIDHAEHSRKHRLMEYKLGIRKSRQL